MTLPLTLIVLIAGALIGAAALLIIGGLTRPQPALAAALAALQQRPTITPGTAATPAPSDILSRVGAATMTRLRITPSVKVQTLLRLQQTSPAAFYGQRLTFAAIGALLPLLATIAAAAINVTLPIAITPALMLLLAGGGWMLPLLLAQSAAGTAASDALDALLVLVDLIVIERLAGTAAHQALANATALSDHPLFVHIRHVLTRAELERIEPWPGLMQLADDLTLPALRDVVAIARIDGGEKVPLLRARVADLRNAQVRHLHEEANAVTQKMTIYKMLPVAAFMMVLIASPLLTLLATA